jgi:class 3 adenylate cyclase
MAPQAVALRRRRAARDHPVARDDNQVRSASIPGPVVGGLIGRAKFIYDPWGDTVDTASRMESHAPPATIHVTSGTYDRLCDRYEFGPRGSIEIKGKGRMNPYLLIGRGDCDWQDRPERAA